MTVPCQKGPDLRRDYDHKGDANLGKCYVRKDLIYEGITTDFVEVKTTPLIVVRKDLIYEGITTPTWLFVALPWGVRKDLIYEGITTSGIHL